MLPAIGSLNRQVTLQVRTATVSPSGEKVVTWADGDTVYASVLEQSGAEAVGQRQVQAETVVQVVIRWRDDVGPKSRMLYGAGVLEVESAVNADGLGVFLTLSCRRKEV